MSQPYGQQPPGNFNQGEGFGSMPSAPPEYSGGPVARPGSVTGAAVLAFVQAGITLISTILVMTILGAVTSAANESVGGFDVDEGGLAIAWVVTIVGLVGAGLLIWAGVKALGGTGSKLMIIACALQILLSIVWIIQGAMIGFAYLIMPIIALALIMGAAAKQYEASKTR
ncbi:hypothetical protein [Actinophytocola oryzae]|uniref:Uncharacterized protein n=1 Tax=Actinophytocola oryzae TaxID=502181 RepID=A0A4R7V2X4_9PSEU|nr:hypothetical protein [Actinophytocola oryzae]TDV43669.1 hypothetical protein CLV71_115131 [Actinophytocola oryzae]